MLISDPKYPQEIAIAYQTLSDPALRKKYNEFGPRASQPEGGFVDPEEIFGAMFGGDRFEPLIGKISLAKDMKAAMQDEGDEDDGTIKGPDGNPLEKKYDAKGKEIISPEEKARRDAKERKISAEVGALMRVTYEESAEADRKRLSGRSVWRNSSRYWSVNWRFSRNRRPVRRMPKLRRAGA